MTYAVFMDYKYEGETNTVVLGGSVQESSVDAGIFLRKMEGGVHSLDPLFMWIVDEDDLPWGYEYQTYYVAKYDSKQPMIGVK